MCILDSIRDFVKNGARTFSEAAHGNYHDRSDNIKILTKELKESLDGPVADKRQLRQDRARVNRDVALAFEKVITNK